MLTHSGQASKVYKSGFAYLSLSLSHLEIVIKTLLASKVQGAGACSGAHSTWDLLIFWFFSTKNEKENNPRACICSGLIGYHHHQDREQAWVIRGPELWLPR